MEGNGTVNTYFDKIYKGTYKEFIAKIAKSIETEQKEFIITANPETFMIAEDNSDFANVLNAAYTTIVPDGIGIVKAANILNIPLKERITGVEICQDLFQLLEKKRGSLYLFGAKKDVGEELVQKLRIQYPDINVLGYTDGYTSDKDLVMQEITQLRPDVLLVALGIPYQELLIQRYYEKFEKGILIGVGGSFDVLSGKKKRAPKIFIKCNLEWLYRIIAEPKRIRRFYNSNVKFIKRIRTLKRGEKI